MGFQRARTSEQIANRQDELINACDKLYSVGEYESVTFTEISEMTSITRPAIYSYYKTKEEILLDLLKREFQTFSQDLESFFEKQDNLTKEEYCLFLAQSITKREKMLRLFSIHNTILETNCSMDKLIEFKKVVMHIFDILDVSIKKFFSKSEKQNSIDFEYLFFVLIASIYPLTHPTAEQLEAMNTVKPAFEIPKFEDLCYKGILLLAADL